jgi:hypothetical protein
MQILSKGYPIVTLKEFIHAAFCILGVCKFVGDIYFPMLEHGVERLNPFYNTGLTSIDLLTATYQTDNDSPILALVQRPNQEFGLRHGKVRYL